MAVERRLQERFRSLQADRGAEGGLDYGDGGNDVPPMDPRVDHLEERMSRVEGKLDRMAETLAGLPKRGEFWALAIAGFGAIAATLAVGLAAMNNQLAAFQAGLGANQATRAEPSAPAAPIIINIPPAASTPPQPPAQ